MIATKMLIFETFAKLLSLQH